MKKIYSYIILLLVSFCWVSCNNEWEDEQYEQYVSFKAPIGSNGVTDIYIRYKKDGKVTYQLPVIISGSTFNEKDLNVKVEVDNDTLGILNNERFGREDLYFLQLTPEHYNFPGTVNVPQGVSVTTLPIDFDLTGINMVRSWVLPLTVVDEPGTYLGHPRKNYAKALLNIKPFNDYSGTYSTTTLQTFISNEDGSYDQANPIVRNTRTGQVVDENTIFFYAGAMEVSIRPTTGIKPLYTTIATVTMNLIVSAAIVLLNPYVTIYISYKIPPFALSVHIPDVSTSIYVEVDSKVLLGLPFCDKAFVR